MAAMDLRERWFDVSSTRIRVVGGFCIRCLVAVFALGFASQLFASEVHLSIDGPITAKTLAEFKAALAQIEAERQTIHMNAVKLNSPGGSGSIGMEIGRLIRSKRLNTYLAEDAYCNSACVSILIGGVQRYSFGKVGVHRSTYFGDVQDDSRVAGDVASSIKKTREYIQSMGVSLWLEDAILTTESWRIRYLTDMEKQRWQVLGTDRVEEEILFNQLARERHISRQEFIDIFASNYDDCLAQAREQVSTVFDCAKSRKKKPPGLLRRAKRWLTQALNSIGAPSASGPVQSESASQVAERIRQGKLYRRYMAIEPIAEKPSLEPLRGLPKAEVTKMEAASVWWVTGNAMSILLVNDSSKELSTVVYSLIAADCGKPAPKRYISFKLHAPLEAKSSAVYVGELPFNFKAAMGSGLQCGEVEAAL
jgi:hypothetical protein